MRQFICTYKGCKGSLINIDNVISITPSTCVENGEIKCYIVITDINGKPHYVEMKSSDHMLEKMTALERFLIEEQDKIFHLY